MKNKPAHFFAPEGKKLKLKRCATSVAPFYQSKKDYEEQLKSQMEDLRSLQELLYAHSKYSLLIIFQAMDAAGKDSAIEHVMSGVNPQGCQVFSFKAPSEHELAHDFLWRTTVCLPERGKLGIFNRSYYEEVLVVRVHPEILRAEPLPNELLDEKKIWEGRFKSIVDFENHLYRNGTRVVKFFLNLSKEEQRKRFLARLDEPDKNWKFNAGDLTDRKLWPDYMRVYEEAIEATSSKHAPWYIVPADDKKNARLIISKVLVETLQSLDLSYPKPTAQQSAEFAKIAEKLKAE